MYRGKLYVEGQDDRHVILHPAKDLDAIEKPEDGPGVEIDGCGGDKGVLHAIPVAVKAAAGSETAAVGFVLDADETVARRWQQVRGALEQLGSQRDDLPGDMPQGGFIRDIPRLRVKVGVWIMPDNQTDSGKLEDLVAALVPDADALFDFARRATEDAAKIEQRFSEPNRRKAELHCWLAWQERPGLRYGAAINAKYLEAGKPAAARFLDWYQRLFESESPSA